MNAARQFEALPPLSLYVHLPWCVRKCPYCDFNSHELKADLPEGEYVDALLADLTATLPAIWGRKIQSVFIGGGTPSLFSGSAIDTLMQGIRALTGLSPEMEVTLEANPGTAEQERFAAYKQAGINRLSMGVQSFNDAKLESLGRIHSADEARRAMAMARRAGFERINLDLMFALPGQSMAELDADIDEALALEPDHLSCYELTLEPNTAFYRHPPSLPDDTVADQMQTHIVERLAAAGFERYEVSAYAKPGEQSRHNLNYWRFGDYVGIGAGAHGKLSDANTQTIWRTSKIRHPRHYLAAGDKAEEASHADHSSPVGNNPWLSTCARVPLEETGLEFMMNALRLVEGFSFSEFYAYTGLALDRWQPAIDTALQNGWLEQRGMQLRATDLGFRWLNELLQLFLVDKPPASNWRVVPIMKDKS